MRTPFFLLFLALAATGVAGCDTGDTDDDDDGGVTSADLADLEATFDCDVEALSLGDSDSGDLDNDDCTLGDDSSIDYYAFRLSEDEDVQIDLESDDFDTFLALFDEDGDLLEQNDDIETGVNTDSRITTALDAGLYVIGANAFDPEETGDYTVSLARD